VAVGTEVQNEPASKLDDRVPQSATILILASPVSPQGASKSSVSLQAWFTGTTIYIRTYMANIRSLKQRRQSVFVLALKELQMDCACIRSWREWTEEPFSATKFQCTCSRSCSALRYVSGYHYWSELSPRKRGTATRFLSAIRSFSTKSRPRRVCGMPNSDTQTALIHDASFSSIIGAQGCLLSPLAVLLVLLPAARCFLEQARTYNSQATPRMR
jgi:hypothetical protein